MSIIACSILVAVTVSGSSFVHPPATPSIDTSRPVTTPIQAQGLGSLGSKPRLPEAWMTDRKTPRPAVLPALYASLGAVQAFDVYSTRRALGAGAQEINPVMKKVAGSSAAMLAVKGVSTAATIYFAERAWKQNRKGAVILMAAINGAMAAIAVRNLNSAK